MCHSWAEGKGLFTYSTGSASQDSTSRRVVVERKKALADLRWGEATGAHVAGYLVQHGDGRRGYVERFCPANKDRATPDQWVVVYEHASPGSGGDVRWGEPEHVDLVELNAALKRRWFADAGGGGAGGGGGSAGAAASTSGGGSSKKRSRSSRSSSSTSRSIAAAAPAIGSSGELLDKLLAGIDPAWATGQNSQKKYDTFHFMSNFSDDIVAVSKKSPMYKAFVISVADACTKLEPGEMERIVAHCEASGMSLANIGKLKRRYFRRMGRTRRPPPEQLLTELHDIYAVFKEMRDPDDPSRSFFVPDHERLLLKSCKRVQAGFMSDNPGAWLHKYVRTLSTGFELFHSMNQTSGLEAYHHPLNRCVDSRGRHASVRFKAAAVGAFDFRHNVRSLQLHKAIPAIGHGAVGSRPAVGHHTQHSARRAAHSVLGGVAAA